MHTLCRSPHVQTRAHSLIRDHNPPPAVVGYRTLRQSACHARLENTQRLVLPEYDRQIDRMSVGEIFSVFQASYHD